MSDSENSTGPHGIARSLGDHRREIYNDAQTLTSAVRSATDDLERYLTDQVNRRPYSTLGVAAGVGYVLGGGLRSRLTAVLLGVATRLAVALAARELATRLLPGAFTSVQNKSS
jgi:ElaB/YqjD/DUF883 family membrane-anchored ribosome-binding protein